MPITAERIVSALINNQLSAFDQEFMFLTHSDSLRQEERTEKGAEILTKNHLLIAPLIQGRPALKGILDGWAIDVKAGKQPGDSHFRSILSLMHISDSLGYLWGIGVEEPMQAEFAKRLAQSEFYIKDCAPELPLLLKEALSSIN